MTIPNLKKIIQVALLFVGSATLLCACADSSRREDESRYDKLMTEYSENRRIITSENGKKKYEFFTPLLEGYTAGREPYREFRKGIEISTFTPDTVEKVDVTITANYAIYYENRKLWEAKGNVVVRKADGKSLYTEQLFWNATTKKIYSNVDTKIVQPDGLFYVSGFVSDEEFRYWSAREADGHVEVEFSPTEPASEAPAKPQVAPSEQPKPATPAKPAATKPERPNRSRSAIQQRPARRGGGLRDGDTTQILRKPAALNSVRDLSSRRAAQSEEK